MREHRRHPVGEGVLDRDDRRGRGIRSPHRVGARADGRRERDLVDAPGPPARGRLVADDEHERHVRLHGLGEGGERVGEPGAVGRGRGGEAAGGAVVGVGGDDAAGLVADRGERRRRSRARARRGSRRCRCPSPRTRGRCGRTRVRATWAETVGMAMPSETGTVECRMCLARSVDGSGCVPIFRAPAGRRPAGRFEYTSRAGMGGCRDEDDSAAAVHPGRRRVRRVRRVVAGMRCRGSVPPRASRSTSPTGCARRTSSSGR